MMNAQQSSEDSRHAAVGLAHAAPDAFLSFDENLIVEYWNPAAEKMFGIARHDAVGQVFSRFLSVHADARLKAHLHDGLRNQQAPIELACRSASGRQFSAEAYLVISEHDGLAFTGLIVRDLSQTTAIRRYLQYVTTHDRLTDLPNRVAFTGEIETHIAAKKSFTTMLIGLDQFTFFNGSMGLAAGDIILKETADRIRSLCQGRGLLARIGGDEFGLVTSGSKAAVQRQAAEILRTIAMPLTVMGLRTNITASVGIAIHRRQSDGRNANAVLKRAVVALHEAKKDGGNRFVAYTTELGAAFSERQQLTMDIQRGFEAGEFELFYQPQVNIAARKIIGAEALLRWRHPERGLLSPAAFIPILETSDMAVDIGRWIIETAARFAAVVRQTIPSFNVGVNLFAAQLRTGCLEQHVASALTKASLAPDGLELEITETTVLGLDREVMDALHDIRRLGVRLAFDDYGTGYASLSLLRKYPLTRLKVDREFVEHLTSSTGDSAIVSAILDLGRNLNLDVIVEGVETEAQLAKLQSLGCLEVQGYLFGKPVPAHEFLQTIE